MLAQPPRQAGQAGHVMVIARLVHDPALRINQAQLMKRIAPVNPGEQPVGRSRPDQRRIRQLHDSFPDTSPDGRPGWNLITAL